jgi:MFS family permease
MDYDGIIWCRLVHYIDHAVGASDSHTFISAFLNGLDATIVATLQTPIGSHFNSAHQASYLVTSYLLSVCCFTPLYGRLSDILGRKGAILLGVTLFGEPMPVVHNDDAST